MFLLRGSCEGLSSQQQANSGTMMEKEKGMQVEDDKC